MTTQELCLSHPVFVTVNHVSNRARPPRFRLEIAVRSQGNEHRFTLVEPRIRPPATDRPTDFEGLLKKEWTSAKILKNDQQGSIRYTLECADDSGENSGLSIHARGYEVDGLKNGKSRA